MTRDFIRDRQQMNPKYNTPLFIVDAMYSSYYPQYHQPLQMLLGKPLYLEVRLLNTPDPNLVLLVHFCVAYPRSGKAVWLLLYNGYVQGFLMLGTYQQKHGLSSDKEEVEAE